MELNDALRRIFGQHRRLILSCVALGIVLAVLMHMGDAATYTASTRFALDTEDPETQAESASIADTAKAIATSPIQVKGALTRARATGRDPVEVAENEVSIRALGSSGVLQLSVSDPNPRASAAISNALAERVINARLRVSSGHLKQVLGDLSQRISDVDRQLVSLDTQIQTLSGGPGLEGVALGSDTSKELRDLLSERDSLTQRRSVLESERVRALSTDALRPAPSIISPATAPRSADSSQRVPDMVLGGLLGLILGVGLAALLETLRPTLVGGEALARELDTPLIGTLSQSRNGEDRVEDLVGVMGRLQLAARAHGVRNVGLVGARSDIDLDGLAYRLDAVRLDTPMLASLVGPGMEHEAADVAPSSPDFHVRPFNVRQLAMSNGGGMGLALVSPSTLKKTELDEVVHLLRMSPGPLLGVITYTPRASHAVSAS
jgi:capsular polysaccharide biosynthesis protein